MVNSALQNYQKKVVKAGPKVDKIRIISAQRAEAQDNISKVLKSKKVPFVNEIDKANLRFRSQR